MPTNSYMYIDLAGNTSLHYNSEKAKWKEWASVTLKPY